MKFIDLTGQRFGRLVVRERVPGTSPIKWKCVCDCGASTVAWGGALTSRNTRSCGCIKREKIGELRRTHGLAKSTEHGAWARMRKRCRNPNGPDWPDYGGRGISICDRWDDFSTFLADMGKRPSRRHSLGRIDNDGDYCPENCRWETPRQQANNKRNVPLLTIGGDSLSTSEWSRRSGTKRQTIQARIKRGWPIREAVFGR